jgi:hypothetical protein
MKLISLDPSLKKLAYLSNVVGIYIIVYRIGQTYKTLTFD